MTTAPRLLVTALLVALLGACTDGASSDGQEVVAGDEVQPAPSAVPSPTAPAATGASSRASSRSSAPVASPAPSPSPTRVPAPASAERPPWFGQRSLELTDTGFPAPQETPPLYVDRRLRSPDHLPPPPDDEFVATIQPVPDELVAESTWREGCPTTLEELRYLTVSYWGFDELHHTGELIVHRDVAQDMVRVFEQLHAARFPMEEVALLDDEESFEQFHRHGDDNVTAAYQCRQSTGSSRWSQHAYGKAIDINPFHNPYLKDTAEGRVVLPAYATAYLDRSRDVPGMITKGDVVVEAFDAIGWGWGGRWNSLKDWQHFSASGT